MKSNFVKQQHYIPQFALKYFENEDGKISFTRINNKPLKLLKTKSIKLMQEKDFYEVRDRDNEYVLRNSIEDSYSYFESNISPNFKIFLNMSLQKDFQDKFIEIVKNEKWSEIEASLLFYLAQLLIRGKDSKKIVYSNSRLPKDYQHIIYLLSTTSQSETAEFAKVMYSGEELEGILHFIKDDTNDGPFPMLLKHIMEKYAVRICITKGTKKLFLSDNPVIVQKFEGEDYILPLSPNMCIILVPIRFKGENIQIDTHIYSLNEDAIDKINRFSILNTDNSLIVSNENDLTFINNILVG
ncbi:hypothetical protein HMPREF9504_02566 [Enterococcus faecalis TX0102]|uniref:DUF4238 domain-containing protein n=1 Tax=Enterococcus faecalis TaxID=1351 RepID=UPI0001E7178B|nr:DUF4238 domain-containing protein [Enterococcus faecalis]EFQ11959.1 hypothetical protein HMPREF9504_02566 [Enterococcus faecalis TX0102]EFT96150.1 hypothetical protein HMPREF9502_02552 [Enterococcus faecalis TX0031]EOJ68428.1 hypothetical protein WMW_01884 [Enterococcus faecalis EnGen0352]MDI7831936.1 DUF4238 domain-containing protein [Enterococcus faecalis]NSS19299.1 DUF4238 domain-containing protein [Enterococcus faecalis]